MKFSTVIFIIIVLVLFVFSLSVFVEEKDLMTSEGKIVCLGCTLKKLDGAKA